MKAIAELIALIFIVATLPACAHTDEEEPRTDEEPVVIEAEEDVEEITPQFEGVYRGTLTMVSEFEAEGWDEDNNGSDIRDEQVTIARSADGNLLVTFGDSFEQCPFEATQRGEWLEFDADCETHADDIRTRYHLEGEGEFNNSGTLILDLTASWDAETEERYSHGTEWVHVLSGVHSIDFSGRAL